MNVSKHAQVRMRQRCIVPEDVDLILAHGGETQKPGKATEHRIKSSCIEQMLKYHKEMFKRLSRIRRKSIIVSSDGEIITVIRNANRH